MQDGIQQQLKGNTKQKKKLQEEMFAMQNGTE